MTPRLDETVKLPGHLPDAELDRAHHAAWAWEKVAMARAGYRPVLTTVDAKKRLHHHLKTGVHG